MSARLTGTVYEYKSVPVVNYVLRYSNVSMNERLALIGSQVCERGEADKEDNATIFLPWSDMAAWMMDLAQLLSCPSGVLAQQHASHTQESPAIPLAYHIWRLVSSEACYMLMTT